jgi:hypothetical protein
VLQEPIKQTFIFRVAVVVLCGKLHPLPRRTVSQTQAQTGNSIESTLSIMSRRLLVLAVAVVGTIVAPRYGDAFAPSSTAFTIASTKRARSNGQVEMASTTRLSMVLEKPVQKKLAKIEELKIASDHLVHPLLEVRQTHDVDSDAPPSSMFCFLYLLLPA